MKYLLTSLLVTTFLSTTSFSADHDQSSHSTGMILANSIIPTANQSDLQHLPIKAREVVSTLPTEQKEAFLSLPIEVQNSLFEKKHYFFDREINIEVVSRVFFTEKIEEHPINRAISMNLLWGYRTNPEVQKMLYQFLSRRVGTIDLVDTDKAQQLLENALKEKQDWAIKVYEKFTLNESMDLNLLAILANNANKQAIALLDTKFPFKEPQLPSKIYFKTLRKIIDAQADEVQKIGYGGALSHLGIFFQKKMESDKKNKDVFKAAALTAYEQAIRLGDINCVQRYRTLALPFSEIRSASISEIIDRINTIVSLGLAVKEEIPIIMGELFKAHVMNPQNSSYNSNKRNYLNLLVKIADELENITAMNNIGVLLLNEFEELPANKKQALEYFLKAADLGNPIAKLSAASLLSIRFEGQEPDKKQALEYFLKTISAFKNDPKSVDVKTYSAAIFNAGSLLRSGFEGQTPDPKRALEYFLETIAVFEKYPKAADVKAYSYAMCKAGEILAFEFEGETADPKRALDFFLKIIAEVKKNPNAIDIETYHNATNNAGCLLRSGFEGQAPDPKRALELYNQSIISGSAEAIINLGFLLMNGFEGQPADRKFAEKCFLRAMDAGDDISFLALGMLYFENNEIEKAISYLKLAEAKGLGFATEYLEKCQQVSKHEDKSTDAELEAFHQKTIKSIQENKLSSDNATITSSIILTPSLSMATATSAEVSLPNDFLDTEEIDKDIDEEIKSAFLEFKMYQEKKREKQTPLTQREKMIKLAVLVSASIKVNFDDLTPDNQKTFNALRDKSSVEIKDLIKICADPQFRTSIEISETKAGYTFIFRNGQKVKCVGTHRKHNKSYKGVDLIFRKDFYDALLEVY